MRFTLAVTLMAALAVFMAGNLFAQTDPDQYSQSQSGATSTGTTTTGTTDPNNTSMQNSGTTTDTYGTSTSTTTTTNEDTTRHHMPRTASNEPLVLLIGLSALVGMFALRFFRLLRAR